MPNQPKTPGRTVRVPDEEWKPAGRLAKKRGETLTDVVRRGLRDYIATDTEQRDQNEEQQ